jgi:nitrogen fixation/metabolism regulation signal transduction histidine kinase
MNIHANRSRLTALTKELLAQWRLTREQWQDAKSAEFEKRYMEELLTNVDAAVVVIDQLDGLIKKIRTDCE